MQVIVPCEFFFLLPNSPFLFYLFLFFDTEMVSSRCTDFLFTSLPLGAVMRPNAAQGLESLQALPTWDLWHLDILIVYFMSWPNSSSYWRLRTQLPAWWKKPSAKWAVPTMLLPPWSRQGLIPFLLGFPTSALSPPNSLIFHFWHLVWMIAWLFFILCYCLL